MKNLQITGCPALTTVAAYLMQRRDERFGGQTNYYPQQMTMPLFFETPDDFRASSYYLSRNEALTTLDNIGSLDEDWDGYGALRIFKECINNTKGFLYSLPLKYGAPEIVPNPNGTLSLEWENSNGQAHLEIGITQYSFYMKLTSGEVLLDKGMVSDLPFKVMNLLGYMLASFRPQALTIADIHYPEAWHA